MITNNFEPAYRKLLTSGELAQRAQTAYEHLTRCDLCAWECRVDRRAGKMGMCRTGERALVSSFGPHLGEEDPLRGWRGSGTIFIARCNLRCQFCQNYEISQVSNGTEVEPDMLAAMMLELQEQGCHNINIVSPSHIVAQLLSALLIAAQAGLHLPLVYNTGGYDSLAALALLDGVIDIYMPDMKYANPRVGRIYSLAPDYPAKNQKAVREMYRQVGDLHIEDGIATRGLLVRHLVLPNGLAGTESIVRFLAEEISPNTYLNLMDQYHPAYKAQEISSLNRRITDYEYEQAKEMASAAGITRLDQRRPLNWIED